MVVCDGKWFPEILRIDTWRAGTSQSVWASPRHKWVHEMHWTYGTVESNYGCTVSGKARAVQVGIRWGLSLGRGTEVLWDPQPCGCSKAGHVSSTCKARYCRGLPKNMIRGML